MPPADPLSLRETDLIRRWIDQGAAWPKEAEVRAIEPVRPLPWSFTSIRRASGHRDPGQSHILLFSEHVMLPLHHTPHRRSGQVFMRRIYAASRAMSTAVYRRGNLGRHAGV